VLQTQRSYDLAAYNAALRADPGPLEITLDGGALEGRLPDELWGGTLYANGPARLEIGGRLVHPFDGHGYVRALRFARDGLRLQARFVATRAFLSEEKHGVLRYRGIGTQLPGGAWPNLRANVARNVANTCVLPWRGALLALWEGGLPHRLDPDTLETQGLETFGGILAPGTALLAHTRWDAARGRLVLCTQHLGRRTGLTFLELDGDGRLVASRRVEMPGLAVTHDFAITARYYVVPDNAVTLDALGALRAASGLGPIMHALKLRGGPGRVVLVPRDGGPARLVTLDRPAFSVHHIAAWDEGDQVMLVTCALSRFTFGEELGYRGPHRPLDPGVRGLDEGQRVLSCRLDPARGRGTGDVVGPWAVEFPRIDPDGDGRPVQHAWGATASRQGAPDPFDALAHVDLAARATTVWRAGAGRFVGEPLVVPRAGGGAWVLAFVSHPAAGRSRLVVLDGLALDAGPVATVTLPCLLPYGFHGYWQR
jgi:all-trans-8'-apo-beta-carotenal 15,15'-oxygenase